MTHTEIAKYVIEIILALLMVFTVTGCSSDRGWRFEIGVSPVSQLENKAGLQHTDIKKEKY